MASDASAADRLSLFRRPGFYLLAAFAVVFAVAAMLHARADGHWSQPPQPGDEVDYDALGLNLARGRGYGYLRVDPEYRAPYEAALANGQDHYAPLLGDTSGFEPITYRPPLLPVFLSVIYATAGRHFILGRLFNLAVSLVALGLTWRLAARLAAPPGGRPPLDWRVATCAGFFAATLFLIDPYYRHFATSYLTEPLATLGITALALMLLRLHDRPSGLAFAATGFVFGLMLIARGIFIFLLPVFLLIVFWLALTRPKPPVVTAAPGASEPLSGNAANPPPPTEGAAKRLETKRLPLQRSFGYLALAVAGICIAAGPWWIRNLIVLEAPMPLGTQGAINMPIAYSDEIIANEGDWDQAMRDVIYAREGVELSPQGITRLEREKHLAEAGGSIARDWIAANLGKLPLLFWVKVQTMWGTSRMALGALTLAVIGAFWLRFTGGAWMVYVLIVAYTASIGLTWTTHGRFRVPVMTLVYAVAAAGLVRAGFGLARRMISDQSNDSEVASSAYYDSPTDRPHVSASANHP